MLRLTTLQTQSGCHTIALPALTCLQGPDSLLSAFKTHACHPAGQLRLRCSDKQATDEAAPKDRPESGQWDALYHCLATIQGRGTLGLEGPCRRPAWPGLTTRLLCCCLNICVSRRLETNSSMPQGLW